MLNAFFVQFFTGDEYQRRMMGPLTSFVVFILLIVISFASSSTENEVEENYENCDPPRLGKPEPQDLPENMVRMGPNSKYFLFLGAENVPLKVASAMCEKIGLQPPVIRNKMEWISIEAHLNSYAPESIAVNLGFNDDMREGEFVEYDGSPMKFHMFGEGQPDNKLNLESCVVLQRHPTLQRWMYVDTLCDSLVTPMCMFKTTDRCYYSSPLTLARVETGFEYVGSSTHREYYVGLQQLDRESAAAKCRKAGYTLVDFDTGLNNNQMLYDLVRKHINKEYLFPRIPFWTGGMLSMEAGSNMGSAGPTYVFESSGKQLSNLSQWPSLEWDEDEPSDSSGIGLENCLSVILYKPYSTEHNVFYVATTNCRIPHFPLCYKDKMTGFRKLNAAEGLVGRKNKQKIQTLCNLEDIKLDLSLEALSYHELLQLALVNRRNSLGSDTFRFKWTNEKAWLSGFMDTIFKVGKKICDPTLIPEAYTNTINNMMILYYNAVPNMTDPPEYVIKQLENDMQFLMECMESVPQLQFETVGGLPAKLGKMEVVNPQETIDTRGFVNKDLILESYWFYFQAVVGSCYPKAGGSKTKWLADIYHRFVKYFIAADFNDRWMTEGEVPEYGVFFGDMDLDSVAFSVKVTGSGAFLINNITDLYFPRPILIPNEYSSTMNEFPFLLP